MSSMWILVGMVLLLFAILYFAIKAANKLPKGGKRR